MHELLRRIRYALTGRQAGAEGLVQDLRLALRTLLATRTVTAVAVLSLALGIGANTAMFSLVNSLMLRSLPVRDPARLAVVVEAGRFIGVPSKNSYAVWEQFRQRTDLFDGMFAWMTESFDLSAGGQRHVVNGLWASGSFFDVLGVQPVLGRTFSDADDASVPGHGAAEPVAVISYGLWQRRFGGAADAIGRSLALNNVALTIVGVTPPDFFGAEVGRSFDIVVPIGAEPRIHARESWVRRRAGGLTVMARLKPGQTAEAGTAALRAIQPQIRTATMPDNWPASQLRRYLESPFTIVTITGAKWSVRQRYERPLLTVLAVVGLVLLIACGNIANLLLARATARQHELSVRRALGASRWRLVRQLLAESAVLAAVGAAAGLAFASWAGGLLLRQISTEANPVFLDLSIDARVMLFTVGIALATVLLFGVGPAFRASRIAPIDALKKDNRASAANATGGLSAGLVVGQVALSLVLVVAAGLLGRSFNSLATRPLGFATSHVLMMNVDTQRTTVNPPDRFALYERVRDAIRAVPDVADVAIAVQTPVVTDRPMLGQPIESVSGGPPLLPPGNLSLLNVISDGWFRTMGMPMISGRDFSARDRHNAPLVTIVNQAFARKFVTGENPIGHVAKLYLPGPTSPPYEIVGLVPDAVYGSLRNPEPPTIYLPIAQFSTPAALPFLASVNVTVRTGSGSPAAVVKSVASATAAVNPQLTLSFHTLDDQIAASLTQERVVATLSGLFGALALLIAGLGLYGVTAYAVSRRRNEIGIRMALGASPSHVVRLVVTRVCALVMFGVALGVGASLWLSKFVATLLYSLQPRDPATLLAAAAILIAVGGLAAWLPARRASLMDPTVALRSE
jgi:putative ABC transport system permease protein